MKKGREQKGCEQDDDDDDVKRNDLTGRNQTSHFTLRRSGSLWPQQWLLPVQRNPGVVQLGANATPLPVLILGCEGLLWFSCGLIYPQCHQTWLGAIFLQEVLMGRSLTHTRYSVATMNFLTLGEICGKPTFLPQIQACRVNPLYFCGRAISP